MKRYDYLIVGGGMAAASAIKGIRELDAGGSVAVVGDEPDPPYDRPPLSKSLWKGKPLEKIWMDVAGAELLLGQRASELRPGSHTLTRDDGSILEYGKLLIATGGRIKRLPFPRLASDARQDQAAEDVLYLHSLADYRALRKRCETAIRFLVVGGGFIASEIAAALANNGKRVTMIFPDEGIAAKVLPREMSLHLNEQYRAKGVEVLPLDGVASLETRGELRIARCRSGTEIEADALVAGLGIVPNVELAADAGLAVDDGIAVSADLRTSDPDVFAAGDVASYFCGALGKRIRPEHEDNALAMGLTAGRNMAGADEKYDRVPYFYSDLFELGYEAVGAPNPNGEILVAWKEPFEKGVVYYLDDDRVRGVLLWNVHKRAEAARALVAEAQKLSPEEILNRI